MARWLGRGHPGILPHHPSGALRAGALGTATGLGRLRSGRYPMVVSVVLTPTTRSQRHRLVLMGSLFLLAALPVGVVLVLLVNWPVAIGYVVVQTAGLLFGVRQQHTAALKLDDRGVQFEPGSFVLRAEWSAIDRIERVELPDGPTDALVLTSSALRWAHTPQVRAQVVQRGWDRIIPLDRFETRWRSGTVGDALRQHRPDLLGPPPA